MARRMPLAVRLGSVRESLASCEVDPQYPGTSLQRLRSCHLRLQSLAPQDLRGDWEDVRRRILWAGGLKDLPFRPGQVTTQHAFNDDVHCDLTTMRSSAIDYINAIGGGSSPVVPVVPTVMVGNALGPHIRAASLPELGEGGSWSTCTNGCDQDPPQDVAHLQFQSRIAFKLIWCPPDYTSFVLVDDSGHLLLNGCPTGQLPLLDHRAATFRMVQGSRYAGVPEEFASRRTDPDVSE
mmetsp:Transcript_3542/g.8340  ORF Transcript_3542/g.8340 Transcript_3542/m.8340 type:complete len:237 (+) Transcript_3542:39-749(+)